MLSMIFTIKVNSMIYHYVGCDGEDYINQKPPEFGNGLTWDTWDGFFTHSWMVDLVENP